MTSRSENSHFAKNARLKYCFVPACSSSASKDPEKIFINVPKGENWLKLLNQLQEDSKNCRRVKLDTSDKIQLKKGILRRFFNCQPDWKRTHAILIREVVQKLPRTKF
ncbi:hypothetical protein RN001_003203 [Aquatica leii]|uniref:Uncharacterized protein n=1 Tax=Aquatica leii TaxID=1421715 RepID=A0AAN7PHZ1_9COLE|nr:hypothetical protein RN001_003203 [Aquatica leii]